MGIVPQWVALVVGMLLGELRRKNGLTQYSLARESDVPLRTIQYWEANGVGNAKAAPLARVARVLGTTVERLLEA